MSRNTIDGKFLILLKKSMVPTMYDNSILSLVGGQGIFFFIDISWKLFIQRDISQDYPTPCMCVLWGVINYLSLALLDILNISKSRICLFYSHFIKCNPEFCVCVSFPVKKKKKEKRKPHRIYKAFLEVKDLYSWRDY